MIIKKYPKFFHISIILFLLILLCFAGCTAGSGDKVNESQETIDVAGEIDKGDADKSQAEKQEPDTKVITAEDKKIEGTESPKSNTETEISENSKESSIEEETAKNEDPGIIHYEDKSIEIEVYYAMHTQVESSSIIMNIDKETGEIDGYIFLSFIELMRDADASGANLSVIKANIRGNADFEENTIGGHVIGTYESEMEGFFEGNIKFEIKGSFLEDGKYLKFEFFSPAQHYFTCIMKKI